MNNKNYNLKKLVNEDKDDDIQKVVHPELVIDKQNNDQSNVRRNLSIKVEDASINYVESSNIQNATYNKLHTDDANTVPKKDLSHNNIDTVTYLKSEFTGLNAKEINMQHEDKIKLPKYTKIDITKKRSIKNKKDPKRKYNKNRFGLIHIIVVQFMGSEKCSEDREAIEYVPETGNQTVRGMYLILMVMHLLTLLITGVLYLAEIAEDLIIRNIGLVCLILCILIIIFAACTKHIRTDFGVYMAIIWVVILFSIGQACVLGFYDCGMFLYMYKSLAITDFVLFLLGFKSSFDYTSRLLYAIALCISMPFLFLFMLISYWGYYDKIHRLFNWHDDIVSYGLSLIFTIFLIVISIAELRLLLAGESIELGEGDSLFGGFLMFVAPIDYPIRMLRKGGAFNRCDTAEEEEE